METEHWQRVESLFGQALEYAAEERSGFLQRTCGDDPEVLREVEALLAANDGAGFFLTRPPWEAVALMPGEGSGPRKDDLSPYRLVRRIGEGGTSVVYLAIRSDEQFQRRVAIKFLRHGHPGEELERRFATERRVLAVMDHPNIATLLDAGTTADGFPYFVMEYVEGEPLDGYCVRNGLSLEERLLLFREICSAVHYAHQNLVVHRDLKPGNILVTRGGIPKLLDFGIAKLLKPELVGQGMTPTFTWHRAMTPDYASPEQVQGKPITTASDVYALGVILYQLLTGRLPHQFGGRSPVEIERILTDDEPLKPSRAVDREEPAAAARGARPDSLRRQLEGDLDNVVAMALRKEPQRRYESAGQLSEDVARYLKGLPVLAGGDTFGYRFGKFLRRNRWATTVTAAFCLVALSSLVALGLLSSRLAEERNQAQQERDRTDQIASFLEEIFEVSDPAEARGESVTAREILDRAADRIARELRDQPEIQASLMVRIGTIYRKIGLYPDAERLLTSALATRRERLGEKHPEVAESLHALGLLRMEQGRYETAEQHLRQALALRRELLGESHPEIAGNLMDLSGSLAELGSYDDAEELARQALELRRNRLGRTHPDLVECLRFLGAMLLEKGDYLAGERRLQEALDLQLRLSGAEDLQVAETLNSLASAIAWNRQDYPEARRLTRRALEIWRKLLGEDHQKVLIGLNNLASYADKVGDDEEAAALYQEALDRAHRLLPSDHPKIAYLMIGLGRSRGKLGDLVGAEAMVRRGLEHRRRTLGNDHFHTRLAENDLGACLTALERYEQAERLLLTSYRALAAERDPGDADVREALRRLEELYARWGRPGTFGEHEIRAAPLPPSGLLKLRSLGRFDQTSPSLERRRSGWQAPPSMP